MNKHTPGQWVLDESRYTGSINRLEPFRHIAMVNEYRATVADEAENIANAHLIAAAPELLEALEMLVLLTEQKRSNAAVLANAHSVLAKARGEQL